MATRIVNDNNFPSLLKSGIVFVDWWAPWCAPCRIFGPIFERVADHNPEVVFAKVNAEEHPDLAVSFGIRAIPTIMIFRDGIPGQGSGHGTGAGEARRALQDAKLNP
jgi:thioredoxin